MKANVFNIATIITIRDMDNMMERFAKVSWRVIDFYLRIACICLQGRYNQGQRPPLTFLLVHPPPPAPILMRLNPLLPGWNTITFQCSIGGKKTPFVRGWSPCAPFCQFRFCIIGVGSGGPGGGGLLAPPIYFDRQGVTPLQLPFLPTWFTNLLRCKKLIDGLTSRSQLMRLIYVVVEHRGPRHLQKTQDN